MYLLSQSTHNTNFLPLFITPTPFLHLQNKISGGYRLGYIRIQSCPCQNRFSIQNRHNCITLYVGSIPKNNMCIRLTKIQFWHTVVHFLQRGGGVYLSAKTINYGDWSIPAVLSEKTIKLWSTELWLVTITQPVLTISIKASLHYCKSHIGKGKHLLLWYLRHFLQVESTLMLVYF
jgi:hypothetical protein